MPNIIYSNGETKELIGNTINVDDISSTIELRWDSISFTSCEKMFYNLSNIIEIDLSNFDFSSITSFKSMFAYCTKLEKLTINNQINSVIDMNEMFHNCSSLKSLDLSGINTSTTKKMNDMFYNCISLITLNLSHFDTSQVTKIEKMFKNCESLVFLDISNFKTNLVTSTYGMFDGCKSLTSLDISSFDTSFVTTMSYMFNNCKNLTSIDISNLDTSSVTEMRYMFGNCDSLISLDLSNFDVSNVINIEKIFTNCTSLISLNISSFNTSSIRNMEKMFFNCESITSLDLSHFDVSSVIDMTYMFANCSNLKYLKLFSFDENQNTDINSMFDNIPEDLIYCISDNSKTADFISILNSKECTSQDCESNWEENKEKKIENKKKNIDIFDDRCHYLNIKEISEKFIVTEQIPETTIYTYDINSDINELKKMHTNLTFIELSDEQITYIKEQFGLDKNEKIYVLILDTLSKDSMTATSWYDYKFLTENGTELNLTQIKDLITIEVSVPIRDLTISNYEKAEYMASLGYDIYNMSSEFYSDYCISISTNDSDVTVKDRKTEFYPNNVTLCQNDCKYKGVNIEDKRVICECNLVTNYIEDLEEEVLNYFTSDDGNFWTYLLDNINFRPFKCGKIIFSFENLKYNYPFYIISIILLVIIVMTIKFFVFKIQIIRAYLFKESPNVQKIKNKGKIINRRKTSTNLLNIFKKIKIINLKKENNNINFPNKKKQKNQKMPKKTISNSNSLRKQSRFHLNSKDKFEFKKKFEENKRKKDNEENDNIDPNEMPFTQALREDKRNLFQIFKSILFSKIDLINIIIGEVKIKEILISEFIISLLVDFFFNALLYSDEIVSHKYHNNGKLDFIVSFSISIISNIISSIVCYFLEYSPLIEQRLEQITEIKVEYDYLKILHKFFRNLKIKISIFFITEIIVIIICFYYSVIFCIIYNKSQNSLFINFGLSIFEDLLFNSLIVSIIIVITRKIGISCSNKYIYNTSKFINEKF